MMNEWVLAINGLFMAGTGALAWATIRTVRRKQTAEAKAGEAQAADLLTDTALKLVEPLKERIVLLESRVSVQAAELEQAKEKLAKAIAQLEEMQKVEEYLRGRLHEKDKELREVKAAATEKEQEIARLKARGAHLEEVCKRAGINGEEELT